MTIASSDPHGGRHRTWLVACVAMLLVMTAPSALAQSPDTDQALPEVEARGAFGVVVGEALPADGELSDPAMLAVLDAVARGTILTISPTSGSLGDWTLTARAADGPVTRLGTGPGSASVRLDTTGLFLVRLDAQIQPVDGEASVSGSWVWRIGVPDRDLPPGEDTAPPPRLQLASGDQRIALEPGSGCFLGTCGDIGGLPPPHELPTIESLAGAPLVLDLGDGSAFTSWSIRIVPARDPSATPTLVAASDAAAPTTRAVFAAPGAGEWQVLVHLTFDRERGSFDGYARLILEGS